MVDSILDILIFISCFICLIIFALYVIKLINTNSAQSCCNKENQNMCRVLEHVDNIIKMCVITTNETLVNPAKAANSFYQLAKEEAFIHTRSNIFKILSTNDLKKLSSCIGDVTEWIDNRIEYHVMIEKRL